MAMFKDKKRIVLLTALFLMAFLLTTAIPAPARAETVLNEDINKMAGDLEIPRGTTVNGDVTLNVGDLTVLGIVNGNINNNMGQVKIGGDVNGDLETNMGQVVITGNVSGNVKTRMGEVIIDGSLGGNLYSDLGPATIGGSVGGDIVSGFGEMLINGVVAGNVHSRGGKVIVNGAVEGDVTLDQGVIELGPNALVSGRVYVARGIVDKAASAAVGSVEIGEELSPAEIQTGETDQGYRFDGVDDSFVDTIVDRIVWEVNRGMRSVGIAPGTSRDWSFYRYSFPGFYGSMARNVINMLILFALAALTYTLFPKQTRAAGNAVMEKTGPAIGWGILATVLAVPLMILLAITIIGIPLIIVEMIFLAAATILGYCGLVLIIGERVVGTASSKQVNPLGAIAIGVLIVGLIGMIPFIGALVSLAIFILAVGTTLVTRFGSLRTETMITLPKEKEKSDSQL